MAEITGLDVAMVYTIMEYIVMANVVMAESIVLERKTFSTDMCIHSV